MPPWLMFHLGYAGVGTQACNVYKISAITETHKKMFFIFFNLFLLSMNNMIHKNPD